MARLDSERWERARADYEVRGLSLGGIARKYAVTTSSVSRRARAEGWTQGKMQGLVERKVAAVKEMEAVETQTQELPLRYQLTLQEVVRERLETEGAALSFARAVARRGIALTREAESPAELELLSRAARNVMPQERSGGTTVNVQQQAAQRQTTEIVGSADVLPAADSVVRAVLAGDREGEA